MRLAGAQELKMTDAWGSREIIEGVGRKDEVTEGIRRLGASLAGAEEGSRS